MVPINDIRGVESMGYAKGEKLLRCKLAAVYRLIDLYGWAQGINNLITVSFPTKNLLNLIFKTLFIMHVIVLSKSNSPLNNYFS